MKEYSLLDEVYILAESCESTEESVRKLRDRNLIKDNARKGNLKGYNCEKCLNKGVVYLPDGDGGIKVAECSCMKNRQREYGAAASGLAQAVGLKTFENFRADSAWQAEIRDKARRFALADGDSFFFIGGQSGCGKTHICISLCGEFLKKGLCVRYIKWNTVYQELLSLSDNRDREMKEKKLREINSAEILCVDNFLNNLKPSEAEKNLAYNITESRYSQGKRTVISSGRTLGEINKIREDIAGRIYEKTGDDFLIKIPCDIRKNYRLRGLT